MPRLALYLLGSPRIERDGTPVEVDTRKAIALIAYLALTDQRHSRDTLAALLWPDYDQSHARATLRRTLSSLNKALAGDWLDIARETVGLNRDADLWVDVNHFSALLAACRAHGHPAAAVCPACVEPLHEAVTICRDDFLAGFSLRDSANFEDWQFFQAQSLRRELASALERLVECATRLGDFEMAIRCARRWLALDRLHEPAHRQLMQLYAWAGQRAAALHQYRECVQVMEQELGVAPLAATTHLYEAIKENRVAPPVAQWAESPSHSQTPATETQRASEPATRPSAALAPSHAPGAAGAYPLVGREAEWAALVAAYAAIATDGHVALLEGEAGIGKTRLAHEFLQYAQASGAHVVVTRCYEDETNLAYGPVIAGLRAAVGTEDTMPWLATVPAHWLSEAARLLPELGSLRPGLPAAPPLDNPGARSRFFEGLRQVLLARCQGPRPGVLFVDDVQWADGASLDLLAYLVRRLRDQPVCLLLAWRSEQLASGQRLQRLQAEVQRSGNATVITLARLSQPMVRQLVRSSAAAGTAIPDDVVGRLYEETEGLPFFLVEYLAALAKGVLTSRSEEWSLPGGVRDLVHSRLVGVDATAWQLLSTAAVIGRSFDFDTLREASGRGEEETVAGLEDLIAQGVVVEMRGSSKEAPTYDFSHEKLRALVYEETSLARRRLLHRRVADVLVNRLRGRRELDTLAGQIAQHYLQAGNESGAAEYFTLAGERARALYANAEALEHFRTALALGHPDTAVLHEAIGDLHTLQGEYGAALQSYETAAALGGADALARVEHKLGTVYQRRGDWELAQSHLDAALAALGDDDRSGERARIHADWSLAAHHRGQIEAAHDRAQRALALAEVAGDTHALAHAHNMLGVLASSQEQLERAQHHLERSLALAEHLADPGARVAALNNLALVCRANGDLDRALALAEAALALCVVQGDRHREAALHNNLADLHHAAGQSEAAMGHLKQSVSIYAEIGVDAGTFQPEIWKLTEW